MRAIYTPELVHEKNLLHLEMVIEGDRFHHLINVVRAGLNEMVILLDGKGKILQGKITHIQKKKLTLTILEYEDVKRKFHFDLSLCLIKKEAMELALKNAVEIGFAKIIPTLSTYSWKHFLSHDRAQSLIESSCIQSNNPFFTECAPVTSLAALPFDHYDYIFYFSSLFSHENSIDPNQMKLEGDDRVLIIIGPEGGLSPEEEMDLKAISHAQTLHLPTYILRSPNALSVASGHIMGRFRV